MRLIDADELKTAFPTCDNSKAVLVASVRATINHMPTLHPVVIQCKDCKYYDHDEDTDLGDWCHAWADTTTEDGFCHHAERINDD